MRKVSMKKKSKKDKEENEIVSEKRKSSDSKGNKKRKKSRKQPESDSEQSSEDHRDKYHSEEEDINENGNDAGKESNNKKKTKQEKEENYKVEKILKDKKVKNSTHYLIRWEGYSSEHDTWEPERSLDGCKDLLRKYKKEKAKSKVKDDDGDDEEDGKEYEVAKILDVYFKRDGKREFLVSWKGFSSQESTWEPEENMDCPELIARFMSKVEAAKSFEEHDLRPARTQTTRYATDSTGFNRRTSKRNSRKERVSYREIDD